MPLLFYSIYAIETYFIVNLDSADDLFLPEAFQLDNFVAVVDFK